MTKYINKLESWEGWLVPYLKYSKGKTLAQMVQEDPKDQFTMTVQANPRGRLLARWSCFHRRGRRRVVGRTETCRPASVD